MSVDKLINNQRIRIANAVIRPDGGANQINWSIVNDTTHVSDYFTGVVANGNLLNLKVADNILIHAIHATVNNVLASKGIVVGMASSSWKTKGVFIPLAFYQSRGNQFGYIQGNTSGWNKIGDLANWIEVTNTKSNWTFSLPAQPGADGVFVNASYVGSTLDRRVVKLVSGLGSAAFGYQLVVSSTGAAVSSNSSTDVIEIMSGEYKTSLVNPNLNDSNGTEGAIFSTDTEVHICLYYEKL